MGEEEVLYDLPTNATTVSELVLEHPNEFIFGGSVALVVMFIVFSVIFVSLVQQNAYRAFAAASFVTFITATLLVGLNVAGAFEWTLGIILAVSSIALAKSGSGVRPV